MDGQELTRELRQGTLFSGERLPRPEQCALQRTDYEQAERAELAGVQHIGSLVDLIMLRVRNRTKEAKDGCCHDQGRSAQRG